MIAWTPLYNATKKIQVTKQVQLKTLQIDWENLGNQKKTINNETDACTLCNEKENLWHFLK